MMTDSSGSDATMEESADVNATPTNDPDGLLEIRLPFDETLKVEKKQRRISRGLRLTHGTTEAEISSMNGRSSDEVKASLETKVERAKDEEEAIDGYISDIVGETDRWERERSQGHKIMLAHINDTTASLTMSKTLQHELHEPLIQRENEEKAMLNDYRQQLQLQEAEQKNQNELTEREVEAERKKVEALKTENEAACLASVNELRGELSDLDLIERWWAELQSVNM